MHTSREGLTQSCIKIGELLDFLFIYFVIFVIIIFTWGGRLTWESMGNYKMCDIMDTVGHRAKQTKIKCSISVWDHLVYFRFWRPCILKNADHRVKQTKIWASGVSI